MVEIYRKSLRFYWQSLPMLLLFSATIEATTLLLQPKHGATITLVPLLIVAYLFHRHFLFDEHLTFSSSKGKAAPGSPPIKFGWFILASIGIILVPAVFAVIWLIKFAPDLKDRDQQTGYILLVMLPTYLIVLSAFGTALPALVERNRAYKLSSGLRATFQTMWRLLLGPALVGAELFAATILLANRLETNPAFLSKTGQFVYAVISGTLGFLPTLLAVAVLCHVYRKICPTTAPPDGSVQGMDQNA